MTEPIQVPDGPLIPGEELEIEVMRAGGPGGQHVNTASTAVRLRFDLAGTRALHPAVKARIAAAVPSQITEAGELLITASRHRSQRQNLDEARARLAALIATHLRPPRPRVETKPSKAARARRVSAKKQRGAVKRMRQGPGDAD
jgi:ribosome-associated protein